MNYIITPEIGEWLKQIILTCTPVKLGYDINLWTCQILFKLIEQELGWTVGERVMTRHWRTWELKGKTLVVKIIIQRGGYNVLSTITAQGDIINSIKDNTINLKRYIELLEEVISNRESYLILFVYQATLHSSKGVRTFVRAHQGKLRILFFLQCVPEHNPDEQIFNEQKQANRK